MTYCFIWANLPIEIINLLALYFVIPSNLNFTFREEIVTISMHLIARINKFYLVTKHGTRFVFSMGWLPQIIYNFQISSNTLIFELQIQHVRNINIA